MTLNLAQTLAWKKSREAKTPDAAAELAMLNDLQGNILKGHGRHHTSNIFLAFDEGRKRDARHFLASVGCDVTSALGQLIAAENNKAHGVDGGAFISVLLTAKGYEALGLHDAMPAGEAFRAGMGARSGLNDPPPSAWDAPLVAPHAMILVATSDEDWLDAEEKAMLIRIRNTRGAVTARGTLRGEALFNKDDHRGIEHFGYVDGRSQPLVLQEDVDAERPPGGFKHWDPAIPLKQLLVKCPGGRLAVSHGSFFVLRKLEQDVKGFKLREEALTKFLDQEAKGHPGPEPHEPVGERAGASVVGRFENGTPVSLEKDEVPLTSKTDSAIRNDFDFKDDPQGLKCPFAGHIRKTNPRADTPDSKDHLMARRGIPYGKRSDDPNDGRTDNKPEKGVGLIFMAYQASLEQQFEFTQVLWANNPDFRHPGTGIDPVIGQAATTGEKPPGQGYPVDWGKRLSTKPFDFSGYVRMRGGDYFFAPSISFLTRSR